MLMGSQEKMDDQDILEPRESLLNSELRVIVAQMEILEFLAPQAREVPQVNQV